MKYLNLIPVLSLLLAFSTGCDGRSGKNSGSSGPAEIYRQRQAMAAEIRNHTRILKIDEEIPVHDQQDYEPGTIEYVAWHYLSNLLAGKLDDCRRYVSPMDNPETALAYKYRYVIEPSGFDLSKPLSVGLIENNGNYECRFFIFSGKFNKIFNIDLRIVIADGKVLIGINRESTFN